MKILIKMICTAVSAVMLAGIIGRLAVYAEDEPENVPIYVLAEAETGTVLEEKNADKRVNAGYLAKLMALLVIAEDIETGRYSLDDTLTASESVNGTKGSVVWLEAGDTMSTDELLKSVIIGNANDALTVLAEKSGGTVEKFTERMNARLFDLGLRDTVLYSPYGYADEREYTTAHDIAMVCAQLTHCSLLEPYFRTWRDFVKSGQTELVSENTLSRTYERHIGFKAAHSDISGYCIAEGGRTDSGTVFVTVILGAEDADSSFAAAKKLLKNGMNGYKVTDALLPDEFIRPVNVKNGREPSVMLKIDRQQKVTVPKGNAELRTVVSLPEYLTAPLRKGQRVGTVGFYNGKTLVCERPIVTADGVKRLDIMYVLCKMLSDLTK